jgi:hypothetical protein
MKANLRAWFQAAGLALLLGGAMLSAGGCAVRGGVAYESGPYGAYYGYYYYPDWDVYFYPEDRIYYWHDDGHWLSGPRPPPRYHLDERHREYLRSHTRQPWTERQGGHEDHGEQEHGHR